MKAQGQRSLLFVTLPAGCTMLLLLAFFLSPAGPRGRAPPILAAPTGWHVRSQSPKNYSTTIGDRDAAFAECRPTSRGATDAGEQANHPAFLPANFRQCRADDYSP